MDKTANDFKTVNDLDLDIDGLSENTLATLQFVVAHFNETKECFHVTHDKDDFDMVCRLCGDMVDNDRYCSWNFHSDCDDNEQFSWLSSLFVDRLVKSKSVKLPEVNPIAESE